MKTCSCCQTLLDLSMFGVDNKRVDGLNVYCKPCVREKAKASYRKDPQKVIARTNAYREANPHVPAKTQAKYNLKRKLLRVNDPVYREVQAARKQTDEYRSRSKELYLQNQERRREIARSHRERNADYYREKARIHAQKFPEKQAARGAKRRAVQKRAIPSWFSEFDAFAIEEAYVLADQREAATGFKWHVDHIVPLQSKLVCGLHCASNLQVIPARVNQRKYNSHWPNMPEAVCL